MFTEILKEKGIENWIDYAFLDENPHLGENVHLLVYGGSKAYGTNLPTSDTDIRGVATNTPEDLLLLKDFEVLTNTATDTVVYSFDKVLRLLGECNPNVIEMLFVREEDVLFADDIGRELLNNKNIFLSNRCAQTFGGYANQQLYRLRQKTLCSLSKEEFDEHIAKVIQNMKDYLLKEFGFDLADIEVTSEGLVAHTKEVCIPLKKMYACLNEINNVVKEYGKNSSRNEKAMAHNKINKHAMHLIRLYKMGTELLTTGTVCTFRSLDHDLLMSIRNGKYSAPNGEMSEEFFSLVSSEEEKFAKAKHSSVLPDVPDWDAISFLQKKINKAVVLQEPYEALVEEQDERSFF